MRFRAFDPRARVSSTSVMDVVGMCEGQNEPEIEQIVAGVQASRKYRSVCEDTVRRLAVEEWGKRRTARPAHPQTVRDAIKAVRSRLHQVYGAYESRVDYVRAYQALEDAYRNGTAEAIEAASRRILGLHASTRERLPILERLYAEVFALTGVPRVLLDLACGLNPLSLPWMGLSGDAAYYAYDIDVERVAFLERYFSLARTSGYACLQDLLGDPPTERGDVALLMKSSACLERQRKGSTLALLDALDVGHAVVTFPVESLGGREKGMVEHYAEAFASALSGRPWTITRLDFATELVFVVEIG